MNDYFYSFEFSVWFGYEEDCVPFGTFPSISAAVEALADEENQ